MARSGRGNGFLFGTLLFAVSCWAVQLGGLSALQHSCNNAPSAVSNYASQHNYTNVAAVFNSVASFNDEYNFGATPACSVLFGLQWWLTSVFAFVIIGVLACAHSPSVMHATGLAWAVVLGITTALLWIFCQRYDTINWNVSNANVGIWQVLGNSGTLKTRIRVTFAGYILESIAAVTLLFGISAAIFKERPLAAPAPTGAFGPSAAGADPKAHMEL